MRNLLKVGYENIWVPVFGRILMNFVHLIEGEAPKQKPTYDLKDKKSNANGSKN